MKKRGSLNGLDLPKTREEMPPGWACDDTPAFGPCSIPGADKGLEVHWGQGAPKLGVQTALSLPCGVFGGTSYSHRTLLFPLQDVLLEILDILGLRAHSKLLRCAPLPSRKSCVQALA